MVSSGWIFAGSGRFMLSADAVFANPYPVKARLRNFCSNALACSCANFSEPVENRPWAGPVDHRLRYGRDSRRLLPLGWPLAWKFL